MDESYDPERVLERLLDELRQKDRLLTEVKEVLGYDERFRILSVLGGVKALMRTVKDQDDKIRSLEKELEQMLKAEIKRHR